MGTQQTWACLVPEQCQEQRGVLRAALGFEVSPLLLQGGIAFAAGIMHTVSGKEGAGFLPLPCWGAAIASLKASAGEGFPCMVVSLLLFIQRVLISTEG